MFSRLALLCDARPCRALPGPARPSLSEQFPAVLSVVKEGARARKWRVTEVWVCYLQSTATPSIAAQARARGIAAQARRGAARPAASGQQAALAAGQRAPSRFESVLSSTKQRPLPASSRPAPGYNYNRQNKSGWKRDVDVDVTSVQSSI